MINKSNSKANIRLPKIPKTNSLSPSKIKRLSSKIQQTPQKSLTSQAFSIFDLNLNPIIQYQSNTKREIASLTKMMTLLCCVTLTKKFKVNMTKCYFRVTANSAGTRGTTAELESRQWVTIEDLLHGMMLPSGNDAANCLSQNFGAFLYYDRLGQSSLLLDLKSLDLTDDTWNLKIYSEQFVKYMNMKAKQIGMTNTNYINPHGLDSSFKLESYSTIVDQAKLLKQVSMIQECFEVMSQKDHWANLKTIYGKEVEVRKSLWVNTHKLLKQQGFLAGKTGQTGFAGNCLATVFQNKHGQRFFIVVLGCSTKQLRFVQTKFLVQKHLQK